MELDWHHDRTDLPDASLIDLSPEHLGIDEEALTLGRLARVRAQMRRFEVDVLLLNDPVNIRYTCGARNMQVFAARNSAARYLLVTDTQCVLFEMFGCEHLVESLPTLTEVRASRNISFVAAGWQQEAAEREWAQEMVTTLQALAGPKARLGMERLSPHATLQLVEAGFVISDAQKVVEQARAVKSAHEIQCIRASIACTDAGVMALRNALRPGITENALWSVLHQQVIAGGGEYFETRLLNSGQHSNPWFQETGSRIIQANELVALDTDVVGCFGYYADFSRTFHAGPDKPSEAQRTLYRLAYEQVAHNIDVLKPGMSFCDYAQSAWDIPPPYHKNRYYVSAHGVGMTGEYPYLYHADDFAEAGYDGEILPGMTLCVESYIGEENGSQGVKLEQQVLITETGVELLSTFPFEADLMQL